MQRFTIYISMLLLAVPAFAAEPDWRDCRQFMNATLAVAACGRLIDESSGDKSTGKESTDTIAEAYANRGFAYFRNGNVKQAMTDYDEALRRNPKLAAVYQYRGLAYLSQHDNDRAIAEFGKGIELDPKDAMLRLGRASAYSLKGQVKLAMADYDAAIASDPKNFLPLTMRGIAYYYSNTPEKARDDFARAAAIAPMDYMAPIWLHIAERRLGLKSQLAITAQRFDMKRWPAPLMRLFLGELTPEALLAPDQPDLARNPSLICDHSFYAGEFMSLRGNKQEAQRLFEAAEHACPPYFTEGVAANAALRSLGKTN